MSQWSIPVSEITNEVTPDIVEYARKFAEYLASGRRGDCLTSSQLRKFFGEVKRQEIIGYKPTELALLKPKLAYAYARDRKNTKFKTFYEVMSEAIDAVKSEKMFKNFIAIFEAIVAYHKVYAQD